MNSKLFLNYFSQNFALDFLQRGACLRLGLTKLMSGVGLLIGALIGAQVGAFNRRSSRCFSRCLIRVLCRVFTRFNN